MSKASRDEAVDVVDDIVDTVLQMCTEEVGIIINAATIERQPHAPKVGTKMPQQKLPQQ